MSEQSIFDGRLERDFGLSTDHSVVNQQYVPSQVENVTVSAAKCIFKQQAKYAVFCFDIHVLVLFFGIELE